MIDLYLLSVVIFFAILGVLIYRDRKNIDFKYILFMRRTKRFRNVLDSIAKKSIRFWKIIGTIAFLVCIFYMIYGTWNITNLAYLIFTGLRLPGPAVSIALPIPSQQVTVGPGFIGIPFWFWIIAVSIILIPHETMHGIIARAEKIKLKDVGLMLLAIFPGAFVEPDEKQMKKSKFMTRMRIFSAGSFINITIGFIVILLVQSLLWAPNVSGILITDVNETAPAGHIGLKPGMVIQSIDGRDMSMSFNDYAFIALTVDNSNTENITRVMSSYILTGTLVQYKPGDVVDMKVDGKDYNLTLGSRYLNEYYPNFAYLGIESRANTSNPSLFYTVFPLFGMIAMLSILVGIFNILPIYPLDGGLIVQSIAEKISKKKSQQITMAITFFVAMILIFIIVAPLLQNL